MGSSPTARGHARADGSRRAAAAFLVTLGGSGRALGARSPAALEHPSLGQPGGHALPAVQGAVVEQVGTALRPAAGWMRTPARPTAAARPPRPAARARTQPPARERTRSRTPRVRDRLVQVPGLGERCAREEATPVDAQQRREACAGGS
ncbi:unnamed protein product [Prorocentrum cordatum]|uniref:Uncharacterized protein n=1 Tax=Prorocentrum cordatum TaxID=2364126 RepID=A0ABN9U5U2_9DINO|nr:unnamed protein product [Polarella glacialis]